jgi:hypothetical protein
MKKEHMIALAFGLGAGALVLWWMSKKQPAKRAYNPNARPDQSRPDWAQPGTTLGDIYDGDIYGGKWTTN